PIAKQKQCAADFHAVPALERVPATDRLAINNDLPAAGRGDAEILALMPDNRVMGKDALVTKKPDIAFLGAADNRDILDQRVFAPLVRVAALRSHHHQPSALEQLADQPDEKSDQRADQDN